MQSCTGPGAFLICNFCRRSIYHEIVPRRPPFPPLGRAWRPRRHDAGRAPVWHDNHASTTAGSSDLFRKAAVTIAIAVMVHGSATLDRSGRIRDIWDGPHEYLQSIMTPVRSGDASASRRIASAPTRWISIRGSGSGISSPRTLIKEVAGNANRRSCAGTRRRRQADIPRGGVVSTGRRRRGHRVIVSRAMTKFGFLWSRTEARRDQRPIG